MTQAESSSGVHMTELRSNETRVALGDLIDRSRQGVTDAEIEQLDARLNDVIGSIDKIRLSLSGKNQQRSDDMFFVARLAGRIRELVTSEFTLDVRDYGPRTISGQKMALKFGNIIESDEFRALYSNIEPVQAYIATTTADSAVLIYIDRFGQYLNDWWQIAVMPVADAVQIATRPTTGLAVAVDAPPLVSEVLEESTIWRSQRLNADLEHTVQSAKTTTADTGKITLTSAFADVEDKALKGARLWTVAVFVLVAAGIVLPVKALAMDIEAFQALKGTAGIFIKALSGLPLFALAAFSGHIAAQHRETARHLTVLTAQMKSVEAYTVALPADKRLEVIMALGHRAFTDPGFTTQGSGGLPVVPEGATDFVKQIRALIESARS